MLAAAVPAGRCASSRWRRQQNGSFLRLCLFGTLLQLASADVLACWETATLRSASASGLIVVDGVRFSGHAGNCTVTVGSAASSTSLYNVSVDADSAVILVFGAPLERG